LSFGLGAVRIARLGKKVLEGRKRDNKERGEKSGEKESEITMKHEDGEEREEGGRGERERRDSKYKKESRPIREITRTRVVIREKCVNQEY